jgi:hypothetical protein
MISHAAIVSLRCAAAVVCSVPTARLRVEVGSEVLDVRRPPFETADHTVMPPCAFRREVARAHAAHMNGVRLRFRHFEGDPRISYGLPRGDRMFPGGILRVGLGSRWLHLIPLTEGLEAVAPAIDSPVEVDDWLVEVGAFGAEDLGITLLHVATPMGDCTRSRVAVEALHNVMAQVTVAVLELFLAPWEFDSLDSNA